MRAPAKIAWISAVGEKGGAEMTMLRTFRYLNPERFAPSVFLLRPGPLEAELKVLRVPVYALKPHRMRNVLGVAACVLAMRRIIRAEGLHLLHSNGFRPHVYGGWASRLAGVPEVWTVHSPERKTWFNRFVLSLPAAQVITNCPRTSDFFASAGHPNQMIWPGVDIARLDQGTPRAVLAERFGLPPQARWISTAARLQRYKGQHHFVRALAALPPQLGPVHGVVIGGALFGMELDYMEELKAEARQLGVGDRVHFTGFVADEDVAGLLAASDLVVHAALDEDFGITVAEAQMLGRAVVAFAAVGPSYILVDGETGRLVPVGDQGALNAALAAALADPATLQRWGQAGRERSRAHYGIVTHTEKTEGIYLRCLRRTAPTGGSP
jgi:glycosyltransferase involved in cell wall biosynthesis